MEENYVSWIFSIADELEEVISTILRVALNSFEHGLEMFTLVTFSGNPEYEE